MVKVALDTNILIYSHDDLDLHKQGIARKLLLASSVVSAQTISEYIHVLQRIISQPKTAILDLCMQNLENCTIQPVDKSTLEMAKYIVQFYNLQIFDSIIIASAKEAGCDILYSEDMQHNQEVMEVRIVNPFL
jgi:predicted nucleic acid-binding protein